MGWAEAVEVKVALQNGITTVLSLWSCEPSLRQCRCVLTAEHGTWGACRPGCCGLC